MRQSSRWTTQRPARQEARKAPGGRTPPALSLIHPNAAGIDIGATEHYVAVPPVA